MIFLQKSDVINKQLFITCWFRKKCIIAEVLDKRDIFKRKTEDTIQNCLNFGRNILPYNVKSNVVYLEHES